MTSTLEIQKRLKQLGFDPGPTDGVLGPLTKAAIVEFKKSRGLRPRPYIGKITMAALFTTVKPENLPPLAGPLLRRLGWQEVRDREKLMKWFRLGKYLGDPTVYPWCAEAAENVTIEVYPKIPVPDNPFWARAWATWGVPTPANKPMVGAWGVIAWNKGGGHIGLVADVSPDGKWVTLLGANQGNQIKFSKYPIKSGAGKFIAFRVAPEEVGKVYPPFGAMASVGSFAETR